MAAPNKFEQNMINAVTKGNPAPPGGPPGFSPDWIKQLHASAGVTPSGAEITTIQPTYGARGAPGYSPELVDSLYRRAGLMPDGVTPLRPAPNAFEQNAVSALTRNNPAPRATPYSPEIVQQLHARAGVTPSGAEIRNPAPTRGMFDHGLVDDLYRKAGLSPNGYTDLLGQSLDHPAPTAPKWLNIGSRMAEANVVPTPVNPMAAKMSSVVGSVDPLAAKMAAPAAKAAPLGAKMAIRGALTDAAAGAKAVLPVAGKALGVVGTGLDWMDQATDPNSAGNRIAAETKAAADAYMAAHRPAAALVANLWGAGRQAVNLSPVGQVGRLYDAAAPVLKDFAAGLMHPTGPVSAPTQAAASAPVAAPAAAPAMRPLGIPDTHPSRNPVTAAAANAHARVTGQPDFHSTHPSTHSAEDWARANSHLTIGQLKALMDMMPKPRSAKDIIGGHALNALQQQYMQQMSDARSAKSKSFWGNDADAIAAAQRQAHDNYVRALLGLAAPSAMPTVMTLGLPEEP